MILTPIRRYGAMILMLLTLVFSSEVLAKTHTTTASQKSHLTKASNKQVSNMSIAAPYRRMGIDIIRSPGRI